MKSKKTYSAPKLQVCGTVQEITKGRGRGNARDWRGGRRHIHTYTGS